MPRRSKSFKNWFKGISELAAAECSRRIASKEADIKRYRDILEKVSKSKSQTFEGYNRAAYIDMMKSKIRLLTADIAKEKNIIASINEKLEESEVLKERFLKHPLIQDVTITSSDCIKIKTDYLKYEKTVIGAYEISLDPKSKAIRVGNLTHEYPGNLSYPHWAVSCTTPCLGEWAPGLMEYAKNFEYFLFFDSMIRYLTQCHRDSSVYININEWLRGVVKKKSLLAPDSPSASSNHSQSENQPIRSGSTATSAAPSLDEMMNEIVRLQEQAETEVGEVPF